MRYQGEYSCGHKGVVELHGKVDKHAYQVDKQFSKECLDCLEKKKEQDIVKATVTAHSLGLEVLRGTEKQVDWANTIRVTTIKKIQDVVETTEDRNKKSVYSEVLTYLVNIIYASWWIEHRSFGVELLVKTVQGVLQEDRDKQEHLGVVEETILTAKDLNKSEELLSTWLETRQTVEIKLMGRLIKVESKVDKDLIELVKSLYFEWKEAPYLGDGRYYDTQRGTKPTYAWYRQVTEEATGLVEDRVAELGYKLIQLGFPIIIQSEDIRKKIINKDFKVESRQWMTISGLTKLVNLKWLKYYDESYVNWRLRSNEIYKRLKSFHGSHWNKETQSMEVPIKYYRELLNVADEYGFYVNEDAKIIINKCEEGLFVKSI